MALFKSKTMQQKVEDQQAKIQMKRLHLAEIQTNAQIRAEKERMASAEMRRLRA